MTTRPAAITRALTATTAALGLLLTAACSSTEPPVPPTTASDVPPATVAPSGALDTYYSQQLDWSPCNGSDECADLRVPLDYAEPDPATDLTIKVLRVPAKDQGSRIGSLVVNPGGPGAPA
jgi:hypothetical protein